MNRLLVAVRVTKHNRPFTALERLGAAVMALGVFYPDLAIGFVPANRTLEDGS
jgi:hypothetical protein